MPLEHQLLHHLHGEAQPLEALAHRKTDDVRTAQLLEARPEGNAVGIAHQVAGARRGVARGLRVDMTAGHRVVRVLSQRRPDRGPDRKAQDHGHKPPPTRNARPDHAAMVTADPRLGRAFGDPEIHCVPKQRT